MIIYKVTNTINNRIYIGQTIHTLVHRKKGHYYEVNNGSTTYFHNALRKYCDAAFTWVIVCTCESREELNEMEFHYIKQYNANKLASGYNITCGGEGTQLFGVNNGMFGKTHTSEVRQRLTENATGRIQSAETISKRVDKIKGMKRLDSTKIRMSNTWEITYPNGAIEVIQNLQAFCRCNQLIPSCMSNVADGKRKHHKNFKCRRLDRNGTNSRPHI